MRPVNLFLLSRPVSDRVFPSFEGQLSLREYALYPHEVEPPCIRHLVDLLFGEGLDVAHLDGFFYSYIIPQVGKEFDLLRFNDTSVLNIELKSQGARRDKIHKQLLRNKYYLAYLQLDCQLFTFVDGRDALYHLDEDNSLTEVPFSLLASCLRSQLPPFPRDITQLFHPGDFLVSPLTTPKKFIADGYFLTPQQEFFELDFLATIPTLIAHHCFGIQGGPGTGKTLLLYDILKNCARHKPCCVIHCAQLTPGHELLRQAMPNVNILSGEGNLDISSLTQYDYLFIDEFHRMNLDQFLAIEKLAKENRQVIVCAFDPNQRLTAEGTPTSYEYLSASEHYTEYKLSQKLRTTRELTSFIHRLMDLKHTDRVKNYPSITLYYADSKADAQMALDYFKGQCYTFISHPHPHGYGTGVDSQQAVGQEFDHVVMLLDDLFYYDETGKLQGKNQPSSDHLYHQFLYLGLTRVRQRLAIIVVENQPLFEKILSIVG